MPTPMDPSQFKRVAGRNTALPLALATILSIIFVSIILHLVSLNRWVDHTHQVITRAHRIVELAVNAESGLRGFAVTGDQEFLAPYLRVKELVPTEIKELEKIIGDNPAQQERLRLVGERYRRWLAFSEAVLSAPGLDVRRKIVQAGQGKRDMEAIRTQFSQFIAIEQTLLRERNEDARESVQFSLFVVIISSVLAAALLAFYSRRQLNLVASTYANALAKQTEQNEILHRQAWLRTAQAQLSERVRGDLDAGRVCSESLNFLCGYLEAKAATMYVVESDGSLKLSAHFGLAENDLKGRSFLNAGTTLAGQVARNLKPLLLDPAPQNHLQISSTLGSSSPYSILIAPAILDNSAKAILELAFIRPGDGRDLELLELISENIGSAINSAQYRARLRDLLEESQRQAEELQTQQEELRVSNEELEEQGKALKESQVSLETQQAELEQSNSQLSGQAMALERQNLELSQIRDSLENKAKELERTSQYKSQFLANMSHELRTPLNSTLILSQLLIDNSHGRLSPEEIEYARTINTSGNDLLSLINDILDLAKVESGTVEVHSEQVEVSSILQNLKNGFLPIAQQKSIEFELNTGSDAPREIRVDKFKLEQILKNLISNAIKFTSKGSVVVSVLSKGGDQVCFEVSDTGIGIPETQHEIIFEAFQQADGTTSRQFGGTGLGLTISRDLAKLLGGRVNVESKVGQGTKFTLTLPITGVSGNAPLTRTPAASSSASDLAHDLRPTAKPPVVSKFVTHLKDDRESLSSKHRLLMIVEDDVAFAKVLIEMSHNQNFQAVVAHSAEDAIRMAHEFLPHAIILDIQLPDHNGLFVLDRLKESSVTRHIPVHIISAHDFSSVAFQMGAIGYLRKPADRDKVTSVLKKLEAKISQNIKRVLIVEDNAVQRESMKKLIADPGVDVVTAETGAMAIELLQSQAFDCLVLDLKLPDMTGYQVLEQMSAHTKTSGLPVIIYTGRTLTRDEEERLSKYSQTIILKGAKSPDRLLSEVSLFLHQVESKMPPERQRLLKDLRDREKTLEKKTILVVDDDVRNIFALNSALEPRGANTVIARNGREALAKLEAHPEIDLVLMDVMMPEMDGFEAMRLIRTNPKYRKLPIIAVTAKAMADDHEKCLEAGASDYLAKPIDVAKLLSLMKVWLHPNSGIG